MTTPVQVVAPGSGGAALAFIPVSTGGQSALGALFATFACAAAMAIGGSALTTGGTGTEVNQASNSMSAASAWIVNRKRNGSPRATSSAAVDPRQSEQIAEQMLMLRRRFSLSMQHLADIIGVTRPVVYRWQNGTVTPRHKFQERLTTLVSLAEHFVQAGGRSLGFALHVAHDGKPSLMVLLQRERLPAAAIRESLSRIALGGGSSSRLVRIDQHLSAHGLLPRDGPVAVTDREDARIAEREERSPRA